MEYHIDYQYLPKGAPRPIDDGEIVGIKATDQSGVVVLPNVGDYVEISGERDNFSGKVCSRLFRYMITPRSIICAVNIVVEESDDNFGKLIKE